MRSRLGNRLQRARALGLTVILISLGNLASHPTMGQEAGSALARDAQKELYRLGCYDEAISGVWTSSSQAAARKFLDRINARLPVDKPDDALLALLQSSKGLLCAQCPSGELFNAAGQCVPKALVDKSPRAPAIVTGTLADTPSLGQRAANEISVEPREPTTAAQHSSPTYGETRYWRSMLKKVDKALGLY